jgi:hypothetical protein
LFINLIYQKASSRTVLFLPLEMTEMKKAELARQAGNINQHKV